VIRKVGCFNIGSMMLASNSNRILCKYNVLLVGRLSAQAVAARIGALDFTATSARSNGVHGLN
jgi:hypothetical protein